MLTDLGTIVQTKAKRHHKLIAESRRRLKRLTGSGEYPRIAASIGVSPRLIYAIASGDRHEMSGSRELRLAEALGIRIHDGAMR